MDVNMQSVQDIDFTDSERAMFNVLRATLQYPTNPQAKREKLVDDIIFFCKSRGEGVDVGVILWELWAVIVDIACDIPSDHSWQEILIQSLNSLRQRDDVVPGGGASYPWKRLPNLSYHVREQWSDPTYTGEELNEEFTKWKNLNSFVARLTNPDFAPWLNLPIWQLRMALEEPPVKGPAMECRLWVACEWISQCAGLIFKDMSSKDELDEGTARALKTGSLCDDKPPLSVERWDFWKKRFFELAADVGSLGFDSAITIRISDVLEIMNGVVKE